MFKVDIRVNELTNGIPTCSRNSDVAQNNVRVDFANLFKLDLDSFFCNANC